MAAMICDLCGSNTFTKADEFYQCDFCRTKYTSDEAKKLLVEGTVKVDRAEDLERFLRLAHSAYEIENYSECYEYASKVLEIDSDHVRAWFLKGASAGLGASLSEGSLKIREMVHSLEQGLKLLPDPDKQAYLKKSADTIVSAVKIKYEESKEFVRDYLVAESTDWDSREDEWQAHLKRCKTMLKALEVAYALDGNVDVLKLSVRIASDNIEGEFAGLVSGHVKSVSDDEKKTLLEDLKRWEAAIQEDESGYSVEVPVKKERAACFVVTASLGSETAWPVITLREFRDTVLVKSHGGRRVIAWYYRNGPSAAEVIRRSRLLRFVSTLLIVTPATVISWLALNLFSPPRNSN